MGVIRKEDYVIFGAEFDFNKYYDWEREEEHGYHLDRIDTSSFGIFYDYAREEFCYVGVCLVYSNTRGEGSARDVVNITEKLKLIKPDVLAQQINTLFGTTYEPKDFKLIAVTIWR